MVSDETKEGIFIRPGKYINWIEQNSNEVGKVFQRYCIINEIVVASVDRYSIKHTSYRGDFSKLTEFHRFLRANYSQDDDIVTIRNAGEKLDAVLINDNIYIMLVTHSCSDKADTLLQSIVELYIIIVEYQRLSENFNIVILQSLVIFVTSSSMSIKLPEKKGKNKISFSLYMYIIYLPYKINYKY